MKAVILVCLVGVAMCAPQLQQRVELIEEPLDTPDPYAFSLNIADDETTNYHTRSETQDENGVVRGSFSYVAPNGIRYITTYSADPINGYQANTVEEQTNIVIVTPRPFVETQPQAGGRF
ncbi:larval cuticle protein A3A-like [Penaeus chinensis]|uniref:larval cuticle protein A3A-like n=1 Tax=Penaeus chinensis TaxID=139456 RepID=UPI001FB695D5|nr:larval cuticle protein A3A-like [Penaeus chinensis]